jgi:hypothetical protein
MVRLLRQNLPIERFGLCQLPGAVVLEGDLKCILHSCWLLVVSC